MLSAYCWSMFVSGVILYPRSIRWLGVWSCIALARYNIKCFGLRQSPGGMPMFVLKFLPIVCPHLTCSLRSSSKKYFHYVQLIFLLNSERSLNRVPLSTVANALLISKISYLIYCNVSDHLIFFKCISFCRENIWFKYKSG